MRSTHLLDRAFDFFLLDLDSRSGLLTRCTELRLLFFLTVTLFTCTRCVVILCISSCSYLGEGNRTDPSALRFFAPLPPLVIFALISTPSGIFCNSLTKAVVLPPTSTKSIVAGVPSGFHQPPSTSYLLAGLTRAKKSLPAGFNSSALPSSSSTFLDFFDPFACFLPLLHLQRNSQSSGN